MRFKTISIVEPELVSLLRETADLAATNALVSVGKVPQYISKQEAYKRAGSRRRVDGWILEGALKVYHGKIDLVQLKAIAASANLATYVHNKDRKK